MCYFNSMNEVLYRVKNLILEIHCMNILQGLYFTGAIALRAVFWHCKCSINYREIQRMLTERREIPNTRQFISRINAISLK